MERFPLLFAISLLGCSPTTSGEDPPAGLPMDTGVPSSTSTPTQTGGGETSLPPCDASNPDKTRGLLFCSPLAHPGYTLFSPIDHTTTWLVDPYGNHVHQWSHPTKPGVSVYLEPSGHLLRTGKAEAGTPFEGTGGAGGLIQEVAWDGTVVWEYEYSSQTVLQHHDISRLPNGNVLMVAWEKFTQSEATALGRSSDLLTSSGLWIDHVIEVDPSTDEIVWTWHMVDHVVQDIDPSLPTYGVIADHPNRVDLNRVSGSKADWTHINGIDYDPVHDHIVLSVNRLDEVWIIDHDVTTEEAAGPAGDILYRWGNPYMYDAATPDERYLSDQHDAEFVPPGLPGEGNLLVFNNGTAWGVSEAIELELPRDGDGFLFDGTLFAPEAPVWSYEDPGTLFSNFIGGTQRLANGNTLVTEGDDGRLIEVTTAGEIVWEYIIPVDANGPVAEGQGFSAGLGNATFRADKYSTDFPGFAGKDLSPIGPIEDLP